MENQLVSYSTATDTIVENASRFTEFLSSETVAPIRYSITVIPNIVKDILEIALQNKQLKMEDGNTRRKAELARRYLESMNQNAQQQYHVELEKIHAQATCTIAEVGQKRDMELARIEADKRVRLQEIQSRERTELAEIQSRYQLARKKQEDEMRMFQQMLKESNKRYKKQIKMASDVQAEMSLLIDAITKKMIKGKVKSSEIRLLENLSKFKVQALDKTADISEEFLDFFMGGN